MKYIISNHAKEKIERRKIPIELVDLVFNNPQQIHEKDGITIYQSKVIINNKEYLLRIFVNPEVTPKLIITVYLTNKITKYWE